MTKTEDTVLLEEIELELDVHADDVEVTLTARLYGETVRRRLGGLCVANEHGEGQTVVLTARHIRRAPVA